MHHKNITIFFLFVCLFVGILLCVNGKIILFINITLWNYMQDTIRESDPCPTPLFVVLNTCVESGRCC